MAKDISRQTILALVVLAIVISLLGTFTVYNEVKLVSSTEGTSSASGQVRLDVAAPGTITTTESSSSGDVRITITR
jgi:hypothetical protein